MSFKPRDMVKNPRAGDAWISNPEGVLKFINESAASFIRANSKSAMFNSAWKPAVMLPADLALSLHAALTNPTAYSECERLRGELEKYFPRDE